MVTKVPKYESIVEKFTKEYGESYRMTVAHDRADFNLPKRTAAMTDMQQSQFSLPVGGRKQEKPDLAQKTKFRDENAQLSIKGSSTIQSAAYWPSKEYLLVSFKSGHTYSYQHVPLSTVEAWEQASSAGSFFYYNIRLSYPYLKQG